MRAVFRSFVVILTIITGVSSLRADEAAVRASVAGYVEAFNRKDLAAVTEMWTEQAVHTDRETGVRTAGREQISLDLKTAFESRPELTLSGSIDLVRLITADVAAISGETLLSEPNSSAARSNFSAVLVRRDGKWLIDTMEETPVPTPPTSRDALRKLEWLVGEWNDASADDPDVNVSTTFHWAADEAFLLRSFAVTRQDGTLSQGTQVIGWDPRTAQIRSWTFNSDGSFGDGEWTEIDEQWSIKSSQTLADGRAASGTYLLKRVDDNSLTLQLVGHEIEGEPQPATPAITVVRVAESAAADATESEVENN